MEDGNTTDGQDSNNASANDQLTRAQTKTVDLTKESGPESIAPGT